MFLSHFPRPKRFPGYVAGMGGAPVTLFRSLCAHRTALCVAILKVSAHQKHGRVGSSVFSHAELFPDLRPGLLCPQASVISLFGQKEAGTMIPAFGGNVNYASGLSQGDSKVAPHFAAILQEGTDSCMCCSGAGIAQPAPQADPQIYSCIPALPAQYSVCRKCRNAGINLWIGLWSWLSDSCISATDARIGSFREVLSGRSGDGRLVRMLYNISGMPELLMCDALSNCA
jgi:hypothetical protein